MSSEKSTESAASTVRLSGAKCSRNYKPWIWCLVVTSLMTIVWALYENSHQEGYVNSFLKRHTKVKKQAAPATMPAGASPYNIPVAQAPTAVGEVQTSYHSIIDKVRPAVISIQAAVMNTPTTANQPGIVDPLPNDINYTRIGSGVIIDPKGYVLSSYHVVVGAVALKAIVYGAGGAVEYPLKVVKADQRTDLVLLRIQGAGTFPYAELGNSDAARTGDMVLTIGSPFGFEQSVTSGMISSRNRTMQIGDVVIENLIQTDSAINSGSSGGPMLNVRGEVIGINTAIFAPTGVFNGIGFAIPVKRAAELVAGVVDFNNTAPGVAGGQLAAWSSQGRQVGNNYRLPSGKTIIAPHGPLGTCVDCHPQLFELPAQPGAGQQVALNGQGRRVGNSYLLPNGLTATPPHTLRGLCTNCHQLSFLEMQAKAQSAAPVALIAPNAMPYVHGSGRGGGRGGGFNSRGNMQGVQSPGAGQQPAYTEQNLGVGVVDVDDIIGRQAQMLHPEGVLVTSVIPGGSAAAAGIQRGDILLRIGGRKIANIASLTAILKAQKSGSTFELVYMRNGSRQAASIKTVRLKPL